jgi:hypothetical protein
VFIVSDLTDHLIVCWIRSDELSLRIGDRICCRALAAMVSSDQQLGIDDLTSVALLSVSGLSIALPQKTQVPSADNMGQAARRTGP